MTVKRPSKERESVLATVYQWCVNLNELPNLGTRVMLKPTPRKGVMFVEAQACLLRDGRVVRVVARASDYYPNSAVESLEACMFRLVVALDRSLTDVALESEAAQNTA